MEERIAPISESPYSSDDGNTKTRERNTGILGANVRTRMRIPRKARVFYADGSSEEEPDFITRSHDSCSIQDMGSSAPSKPKVPSMMEFHLPASSLTKALVEELLPHVEFLCPSNVNPRDDLCGATESEILEDLLKDMKCKRFPVSATTKEDCEAVKMQPEASKRMHEDLQPLFQCLERVPHEGNAIKDVHASYKKLRNSLIACTKSIGFKCSNNAVRLMTDMQLFLEATLDNEDTDPHGKLEHFWISVLSLFQGFHSISDEDNEQSTCQYVVKAHGHPITVDLEVDLAETGHHKLKQIMVERVEAVMLRKISRKLLLSLHCQPDIVVTARNESHRELYKLILKVNTSRIAAGSPGDPGSLDWVDISDSGSSNSSRHQDDPDYETTSNCADNFRLNSKCFAQLMIELIGAMRKCKGETHILSLYCVMHRVYVVGLHVEGSHSSKVTRRALYVASREYDSYRFDENTEEDVATMKYRFVCTKPFNILKPEHFKALVQFIPYLLFKKNEHL